jgi:hypothetical protein
MTKNLRVIIWTIVGTFLVLAVIIFFITQPELTIKALWGCASMAIGIEIVLAVVFYKWCWSWWPFQRWLVVTPDIRGTWIGEMHSSWVDPETNKKIDPIPTMITIQQTLFSLSCVMWTGESKSESGCACFEIDPDNQKRQFAYIYRNQPKHQFHERSSMHEGSAIFDIAMTPEKRLIGRYWTDRLTKGDVDLKFESKDTYDFPPKGFRKHPVSGSPD